MSQTHSYAVEHQTNVNIRDYRADSLKEFATSGWVLVGAFESDKGSYAAMDQWFAGHEDGEVEVGQYRLVEFTSYGGNFIEFEVKQTLVLEEVKRLAEVS